MQLNIHDSTLKRVGFINNNLPDALHYFDDNWHRYLAEGTSTFDFSVNKINSSYALLTLKSYISFTYDGEDYLFNIINIEQDHYSMHLQCENLNLELISEEVGAYGNTKRHSIVWYLKNVAKITDDFVEIGNNPFPLNDEDSSNPILSFDSTDTKLARIISICNSFNAEFQFRTQLKNDGTLQNITIDLYKEEGVGQKRKDVTLYYGKNIAGITSKADRTSTFFNATTVTDSKNKFNWLSVEGKHYNSDGQLEFYKNAGDNTAYAPLSRDMFPSQLKSSSSDRYTRKNLSIEATSANGLWDYAVSQFKLYAYPQMTYEVVVSVNAVTSALGNDKKLNIGDTIIVQDSTFDKSDGGLILSARVSQQEISFTNPLNNKITFTNFVKLKSEISADLYGRMKDLVDQNTPYKAEVETTNGLQFKNGKGSTTLTARIYFGSDSTETKADSYSWTKDGTLVADVQEITVDASGVSDKAVYSFKATVGGKVVGSQSVTITNVNDGKGGADGKTSYTHVAWSYSADGTDRFTTVYPNLNLLNGTTTFNGMNTNSSNNSVSTITKTMVSGIANTVIDVKTRGNAFAVGCYIGGYNITVGQTITISFIAKSLNDTEVLVGFENFPNWRKMFTITPNWKIYTYTFTATTSGTPDFMIYGWDMVAGQHFQVYNPKVEEGSTATPWMPSKSEVKTSDYPNFIGQYTNDKVSDSTNPSDYTWSLIRGNDGKDGATGKDGIAGKDGVGIKTTVITYAISTSGTTAPDTGWTSQVPTLVKGQYLWTKTVWTYTDNSSETGYSVTYIAKDGNNGNDGIAGKDGVGISNTIIEYVGAVSGTSKPTSGWSTTIPTVPAGQYLWTRTTWQYTDGTSEQGFINALMGLTGASGRDGIAGKDGKGIKATAITYQASTNGTTAPTGAWSASVPTVAKGSFLWTRTIWTYTDNTTETGYAVAYMGTNGNNGANGIAGKDGTGIKTTTITYAVGTSGTTAPSSGWNSQVPNVPAGQYLWTKTVWDYTDKTSETGYSVAMMGVKGDKGDQGVQGIQGVDGHQGIPGPKGADGKTQYTHIAYANSADGSKDFSTSDSNRAYIGMYVDFKSDDSTNPSDYSWTLVKGADGTQGIPGKPGKDGTTPYFHTAWSNSADGTLDFNPDYKSAVGLDVLNITNWEKNWEMSHSTYNFVSNTDSSFKVTGKGTGGGELLSKTFPAKVGDKLRFTVHYTNRQEFGKYDSDGLQFVVNSEYTASFVMPSKIVLPNKITAPTEYHLDYTAKTSNVWMELNFGNVGDWSEVDFDVKIEVENLTNPVKYAYIGTHSDYTATDSTNPTDYTWSLIRGIDGKDGATGKDGVAGKDGVGIKTTVITYALSSSGTDKPVTGWTSQVPTLVKGQYLWTKTVWTYSDTTSETGYTVSYIAKDGNNGNDGIAGKDGTGIKKTTITYTVGTSGTTAPTSGWNSQVPTVAAGSYLWTKTVWAYTDNSFETGYSVGKMGNTGPAGPAGSDGNPGKIVSDTEPTTKFKGLTWKYSGVVDMTLGDGTKILAGTEYYWNGTVWALYEINAHNINGDNLSVTNGTFKDGKIESVWGSNGVNGTTTIEGSHLQIYSSNSTTNTENTVALDNLKGYAQVYTDHNTGRTITVQASFQGFFVSDSTGPYVRVTPNGIKTSSDKSYNSFQIGAGITLNLKRRGDIVEATLSGSINSPLSSNTNFTVGTIPVGYRPNRLAYIMVHMTSSNNSSHIDVGTNGVCTWWGTSTHTGAPRGHQMWFTDDPLLN